MKCVFFRFQRMDEMDPVMKGLMGAMSFPRIFGVETPLNVTL